MNQKKGVNLTLILILTISLVNACDDGCAHCDPETGVCFACQNGHQLTLLGACVPDVVPNCRLYLNAQQCLRCLPTFKIKDNLCQSDYSGCFQNISSTRCAKCSPELTLNSGSCSGVLNCATNSSTCSKCQSGFTLSGNKCLASPQNCQIVDSTNGVCFICNDGYHLVGFKCIADGIKSDNCYLYDEKGCYFCKDGYTLVQGECRLTVYAGTPATITSAEGKQGQQSAQPEISSAGAQNSTKKDDFPIDANLKVIQDYLNVQCKSFLNGTCIDCYPSYYLNEKKVCVQIDPLCRIFNHSSSKCSSCYPGYSLNDDGKCIVLPPRNLDPNCRVSNNTICLECYSQYHILNEKCVADNPLCKTVNLAGSCTSCYGGYDLIGSLCVKSSSSSDPFCIRAVNDKCITCSNGYYLQNSTGLCKLANLNCFRIDDEGKCTACLPNYMLLNNNCIYPVRKCNDYNSTTGKCLSCEVGYYISHDVCYPKDLTCQSYNPKGQCIGCITTYYLISGKCVFPALGYDPFCTEYLNSYCVGCASGTYLDNFVCRRVDSKCIDFDFKSAKCKECKEGFRPLGPACF